MTQPLCPRCRSEETERVPREGFLERLASLVYVYPFRCRTCLRRFRAVQWGQRYVRSRRERRREERHAVDLGTTLWLEASGESGPPARVRDISTTGLALETQAELQPGQHFELDLQAGTGERPIRVEVAVVRTVQSGRVGLQFVGVKGESDERLRKFLSGREGHAPAEPTA
ncbi:MAG TPA: PilZ domain-containing protein [Methylomirabilota bacterium]|nr:PilZ domain-containing protein [Methylomirabilota bacterium]